MLQTLVTEFKDELAIEMVPFQMMTYIPSLEEYQPIDEGEFAKVKWKIRVPDEVDHSPERRRYTKH